MWQWCGCPSQAAPLEESWTGGGWVGPGLTRQRWWGVYPRFGGIFIPFVQYVTTRNCNLGGSDTWSKLQRVVVGKYIHAHTPSIFRVQISNFGLLTVAQQSYSVCRTQCTII